MIKITLERDGVVENSFELDNAEVKAAEWGMKSIFEWVENAIRNKSRQCIDAIYKIEAERMIADPDVTNIPADKKQVILDANIKSGVERNAEYEASLK